jgi:putative transposase
MKNDNSNIFINEFIKKSRNLPHIQNPGSYYFITYNSYNHFVFTETHKEIISENLKYFDSKYYNLYSFVIMPDHIHLIIQPLENTENEFYSISKIMHSLKSYTSKKIINSLDDKHKSTKIYQSEYYDRIIRNENDLFEKLNYIVNNPVKAGLSDNGINYKWFYLKEFV